MVHFRHRTQGAAPAKQAGVTTDIERHMQDVVCRNWFGGAPTERVAVATEIERYMQDVRCGNWFAGTRSFYHELSQAPRGAIVPAGGDR